MLESEFIAAAGRGKIQIDDASAEPEGGAPLPVVQPISLEQFLPILLQLQSTQRYLTAAPTFIPQTFQDQIQFVYTGGVYSLYLYINNQWSQFSAGGGGGTSINGRSGGSVNASIPTATTTQVQFRANSFANGITWTGASYGFTVVTAGQYLLTAMVAYATAIVSGAKFYTIIEVNGTIVSVAVNNSSGNLAISVLASTIQDLSVGDVITVYCSQSSGFFVSLVDDPAYTYLTVAKV
jgi:hypothetical protein